MDFQSSLSEVLKSEGGYVNDPNDPGGETNFGISKRAFPSLDIKALTAETVAPIYRKAYWDQLNADLLPSPLNYMAFDCAVNQGVSAARGFLAQTQDYKQYYALRLARYQLSKNWPLYGHGWTNRLNTVLQVCEEST